MVFECGVDLVLMLLSDSFHHRHHHLNFYWNETKFITLAIFFIKVMPRRLKPNRSLPVLLVFRLRPRDILRNGIGLFFADSTVSSKFFGALSSPWFELSFSQSMGASFRSFSVSEWQLSQFWLNEWVNRNINWLLSCINLTSVNDFVMAHHLLTHRTVLIQCRQLFHVSADASGATMASQFYWCGAFYHVAGYDT